MHNPPADLDQSKELVPRLIKLKAELQRIQEYRGEVFEYLKQIEREVSFIERKQNPENEKDNKVLRSLKNMKRRLENIENLLNIIPTEEDENCSYYKVKLRRILNFGILDIESENLSISAQFKGRLFEIINELIKKYIEDSKTDVPIEFRGYVSRKKLEKQLYGKYMGRNRLNSHLTRIRGILVKKGLTDTSFIKSMDDFVRLNFISNDVTITTITTDN